MPTKSRAGPRTNSPVISSAEQDEVKVVGEKGAAVSLAKH